MIVLWRRSHGNTPLGASTEQEERFVCYFSTLAYATLDKLTEKLLYK